MSTICVLLKELAIRLGKVCPALRSRRVMLAPLTKLLPLIVKACALSDPVTGLGLTLLMLGAGVDAAPSCVTENVCPAMVMVPVRELVLVLDVTE